MFPQSQRRLAAIMFTDIVGYTALTQKNESLALALLARHNDLIRPLIAKHNGIEVKTIGDSFLVEFGSALEASECAIALQKAFFECNANSEDKILVRIGIHVGDVVRNGSDIFGDAVNIASRIESLAQGGEICISEQVFAQVRNKIPFRFTSLEPRALKNVAYPIVVYKIELNPKMNSESLLDLHRIAVLPFANISPDPNDAYFADGLTEELISKLSLVKGLRVIARTSVMKYKGMEKGVSEIARELGSGVIVEGSVRKAGNRIRVTVQVIDANTEEHLWTSSYDNNLDDIFDVQESIAIKVSESIPASLVKAAPLKTAKETNSVDAYTYYLKGKQLLFQRTDASIRQALELFIRATKLDPNFARAHVLIGRCYAELGVRSYLSKDESLEKMKAAAKLALEIDPNLDEGHSLLSYAAWGMDDFPMAEAEARKAIDLNPSLSEAYQSLGQLMLSIGYPKKAIDAMRTALALDPLSPWAIRVLGQLLLYTGREAEALDLWNKNLAVAPFDVHLGLATYYFGKKDIAGAAGEIKELAILSSNDFNTLCMQGYLAALKGDQEATREIMDTLEKNFKGGATIVRNTGYMKFFLGDIDGFFESMFYSAETHVLDPLTLRYAPFLENARQDPRYVEVLKKVGLTPDLKE